MTSSLLRSRRQALGAGAAMLAAGGCSGGSMAHECVVRPATGATGYCLVEPRVLRVPGAARLAKGQAVLLNVDDNTAVIIVRDDRGWYALSAICTHQCCLLALCESAECSAPASNPGDCRTTSVATPSATGDALVCPCHGSTFRLDGTVAVGPATRPLPHYSLAFEGDDALVDTSNLVAVEIRV